MKKAVVSFVLLTLILCGAFLCNGRYVYAEGESFSVSEEHFSQVFNQGDGSQESPFLISSADQLFALAMFTNANSNKYSKNKYFKQTTDIDLKGYSTYEDNKGWPAIGKMANGNAFKGVYDGDMYKISNLVINRPDDQNMGLFGVSEGIISNIIVSSGTVKAYACVGGVAGTLMGGTIDKCVNYSDVYAKEEFVGGIAGGVMATPDNNSLIIECINAGKINCANYNTGGIVGGMSASYSLSPRIERCVNIGAIRGHNSAGGIVGVLKDCAIINSYNNGSVKGYTAVGGLVGANESTRENSSVLVSCFNIGKVVSARNCFAGGIVGYSDNYLFVQHTFYNYQTIGRINCAESYAGNIANQKFAPALSTKQCLETDATNVYFLKNDAEVMQLKCFAEATGRNADILSDLSKKSIKINTSYFSMFERVLVGIGSSAIIIAFVLIVSYILKYHIFTPNVDVLVDNLTIRQFSTSRQGIIAKKYKNYKEKH